MNELKIVTYNIDGLPESIDLKDLPWPLKPISWVYKLVKGTTVITINDNEDKVADAKKISRMLNICKPDLIAVQEDFNYHDELASELNGYECRTYMGGFDLKHIFSSVRWFPYPRFKSDGLNIMFGHTTWICCEDIVRWKDSYGYFAHANDKLTMKGFRYYCAMLGDDIIDIYIIHMDADFYNPDSCPYVSGDINARKSQLQQLANYIIYKGSNNPAIIMGDTNSSDKYPWDVENINDYLLKPINAVEELSISEAVPSNRKDVDRIFIINNRMSESRLEVSECYFNETFVGLSDHLPLFTTIKIEKKNNETD